MSRSREERAGEVLRVAELAARNLILDLDDADDPNVDGVVNAYDSFTAKVRYLRERAAAGWTLQFQRVLDTSHSMRIETLPAVADKDQRRCRLGRCMACGRNEQNCRYVIDLAGCEECDDYDSEEWAKQSISNVTESYSKFADAYEESISDQAVKKALRKKSLVASDKGAFVVGATCLRKAKLRFAISNLMLELCYDAEREMESLTEAGQTAFRADTFYTLSEERAEELVARQDTINLAVADEKRKLPDLAMDLSFWSMIDKVRRNASGGDEHTLNALLRSRAVDHLEMWTPELDSPSPSEDGDQEYWDDDLEWSECGDEENDETLGDPRHQEKSASKGPRLPTRYRRNCISDDSDDEAVDSRDEPQILTRAKRAAMRCDAQKSKPDGNTKHQRKRAKSIPASEDEEDEEEGECGEGANEEEEEGSPAEGGALPASSQTRPSPRSVPPSASKIAGIQRRDGVLPARRLVARQLMNLQLRLCDEGRHADAALVGHGVLTIEDLLCRVDELSHTI